MSRISHVGLTGFSLRLISAPLLVTAVVLTKGTLEMSNAGARLMPVNPGV
jgi:hypothetical protein